MALPMQSTATFNLTIPSTGKNVRYRPFLVKDEKALLIAQQSEDPKVMSDTLISVIKSCVLDPVDTNNLATFDVEYIFLQIRGKSVGETVDLFFPCDIDHGEQNDKAKVKIILNVSDIEVKKDPSHSNKIALFDDVGVVMKYPTLESANAMEDLENIDNIFSVVVNSIDYIYDGEDIHYAKEQSKEELLQFLNNLSTEQFLKIQKFFDTMPKLSQEVEYKCPLCGKEHKKTIEGLSNFF